MTKAEMRKLFMELRDMCKNPKFEVVGGHLYSKGDQYSKAYSVLTETGTLDVDYMDHIKGGNGYEMASHPEKLTFEDCCTVLTYILRSEHWSDGAFAEALENGTVYKVLSRAVEVM